MKNKQMSTGVKFLQSVNTMYSPMSVILLTEFIKEQIQIKQFKGMLYQVQKIE
jgi:hypothetical protein